MDTDVIVLLIGNELVTLYPAAKMWVAFGTGKNCAHLRANVMCDILGKDKSVHVHTCFPRCHRLRYDICIRQQGRTMAWQPEVVIYMESNPYSHLDLNSQNVQLLEQSVPYDKSSTLDSVNETKKELVCFVVALKGYSI